MRKLVSSFFISLDGVVEAPPELAFPLLQRRDGGGDRRGDGRQRRPADGAAHLRGVGRVLALPGPGREPDGEDHERDAEVRRLDDARRGRLAEHDPAGRRSHRVDRGHPGEARQRTSACRGVRRSSGRCSGSATSTSCACSCIRSLWVGREAVRGRTGQVPLGLMDSRTLNRSPRPHLPTGSRVSGTPAVRSADRTSIAYDSAGDGPALIAIGGAFGYRRYRS